MARRPSIESSKESVGFELSKFPDEAGQLGAVLNLIEQQQQDLKGYVGRIESAIRDLEKLEERKKILLVEVSDIEISNENLILKLNRDLEPLVSEVMSRNDELEDLKLKVKNETILSDEKIKELQNRTKKQETVYLEIEKDYQNKFDLLKNKQEELENFNKNLENKKLDLENQINELTSDLIDLEANKAEKEKKLVEFEHQVLKLNNDIGKLRIEIGDLNTDKEKLKLVNQKLVEDRDIKSKQLEDQFQKDLKLMEEEKKSKKKSLKKTEDSLAELTLKLEAIKAEYNKITGMIAGFINKKNEVERKEEIIKKKYTEAGFNW